MVNTSVCVSTPPLTPHLLVPSSNRAVFQRRCRGDPWCSWCFLSVFLWSAAVHALYYPNARLGAASWRPRSGCRSGSSPNWLSSQAAVGPALKSAKLRYRFFCLFELEIRWLEEAESGGERRVSGITRVKVEIEFCRPVKHGPCDFTA